MYLKKDHITRSSELNQSENYVSLLHRTPKPCCVGEVKKKAYYVDYFEPLFTARYETPPSKLRLNI